MNYKKVKAYLREYRSLCGEADRCKERIETIEASLQKSLELDGLPHGTKTADPTRDTALKLVEARNELKAALLKAELKRQAIADDIERMHTPQYKKILFLRYIREGMTWELITDEISKGRPERYDSKHIRGYMHDRALEEFERCRRHGTDNSISNSSYSFVHSGRR